ALALTGLAAAYAGRDPRQAARLLGAADALLGAWRATLPLHRTDAERARAEAAANAGDAAFGAAYAEGRGAPPEDVVAEEADASR
ncbi:hypothetical protein, partial [Actinomadura sediminis]